MIPDNIFYLKIVLVQGYKNELIELIKTWNGSIENNV